MLEDCLIKEVGTPGPTNIGVDATGQHCLNESQKASCLGSKSCSGSRSNVSGPQITLESSSLGRNDLYTCGSVGSPLGNHENHDVLRSGEFQIAKKSVVERNLRYGEVDSWPRSKRRKTQDQETYCFSASPNFRVKKQYARQMDFRSMKLKKVGDNVEFVPAYASPVNESTEVEICQNMACQLTEGKESLPKLQTKEVSILLFYLMLQPARLAYINVLLCGHTKRVNTDLLFFRGCHILFRHALVNTNMEQK